MLKKYLVLRFQGSCRDIVCYSGKFLSKSECQPLFPITMNLRYNMEFMATVDHSPGLNPREVLFKTSTSLQRELQNYLGIHLMFTRGFFQANRACDDDDSVIKETIVQVELNIFIIESISRLQVERKLNDFLTKTLNTSYSLIIQLSGYENVPNYGNTLDKSGCRIVFSARVPRAPVLPNAFTPFDFYLAKVSNVLLCRQIELEDNEYNITEDQTLILHRHNIIVNYTQYDVTPDKKIRVCYEILENMEYFGVPEKLVIVDEKMKNLWIASLVCTVISVICLLASLVVYLLFPSLRTTAGKLIMILITSLLFALIFQTFAYFAVTNKDGCAAVGLILHFSWLSVFTSMHACNFYMFKVFTSSKPRGQSGNDTFCTKSIAKNVIYIFGLPLAIVILHIIVVSIATKGESIGYGGSSCTFVYQLSHILAAIVPVAVICLTNVLFFFFTARTISNTPKPERSSKDRNEMIIFLRLTSITGLCWLLLLIDAFLPLSAFSFIAVIVSSLQGLYIFIAFILNKRNFAMFKEKAMESRSKSEVSKSFTFSSSKTSSSKLSSSANTSSTKV